MSEAVKRRGGKPNRGGGRFNKPSSGRGGGRGRGGRGGGGRGRGRGKPSLAGGGGEGRKAGASAVAEGYLGEATFTDLDYDVDDDFDFRQHHQSAGPKAGGAPSFHGRGGSSTAGVSRGYRPRPGRGHHGRKVQVQRLHMTNENQDMVREMLKSLQGADLDEVDPEEYDELDVRMEDQYWLTDSRISVQEMTSYSGSAQVDIQDEVGQARLEINRMALQRLQRYGFHVDRCIKALQANKGDVGASMEYLYNQCLTEDGIRVSENTESEDLPSMDEALEQRRDEAVALESIYDETFKEKISDKLWVLHLDLPHFKPILEVLEAQKEEGRRPKFKLTDRSKDAEKKSEDICKFYLKGNCRFGRRCRHSHVKPEEERPKHLIQDQEDEVSSQSPYEVEIRFPAQCLYPYQPPIVAFTSNRIDFPIAACLNISLRLNQEAQSLAESHSPAVFSLVSVLEDEDEMWKVILGKPHRFSLQEPVISARGASKGGSTADVMATHGEDEESSDLPEGSSSEEETNGEDVKTAVVKNNRFVRPVKDLHVVRSENRKLKDRFKKKQTTSAYRSMLGERQKLPAWNEQDNILKALNDSQVLVVSGMTGCGKTTQVPQFILDDFLGSSKGGLCSIICTQPRRISATAVADRVANERVERLGNVVGYQIRLESKMSTWTRLVFCTTGVLLRRLEGDSLLEGITHIIVDEVHERSEESDFLIMVLKDLLPKRPDIRIILMSATLNADLFSMYFGNCPVIEIPGKIFPVDQYFLEDAIDFTSYVIEENSPYARSMKPSGGASKMKVSSRREFFEDVTEQLKSLEVSGVKPPKDSTPDQNLNLQEMLYRYTDLRKSVVKTLATMDFEKINNDLMEALLEWIVLGDHQYPKDGAVLVFLPGLAEITSLYEQLQSSSVFGSRSKRKFNIIPLHSSLSSEDQQKVFYKPKEGTTKIVLSTNIAETSITIDDVVFVIDAGRMKEKRYDHTKGMESLEVTWVSKANALQRKGRAGRVASGVCFHLFTSHSFDHIFREQQVPEIQRAPLEQLLLRIKILDIFKDQELQHVLSRILEPPDRTSIETAIVRLQDLGALNRDQELTPLGYHLAQLPVDVRIGKLMLFGAIFRCLDPVLTIAASLSFRSPFVAPFDKRDEADKKKQEFAIGNSDHLTLLNAYKGWTTSLKHGSYAGYRYSMENFLSIKTLKEIVSMKRQFTELLSSIGFVKEGLTARQIERSSNSNDPDGIITAAGEETNLNANNQQLVAAMMCAALYPNVVQVLTPESKYSLTSAGAVPKAPKPEELRFKTRDDGYVFVHPSSVNFQVRHYESPYLVYHEKIKTSKIYIRDCSMVSVYPLLLFGGGSLRIDLEAGNFVISLDDGWIRFIAASHEVAELVRELRLELDQLLADKIENPNMDLCNCPRGSRIIDTIVKLITTQ
ncbi:PREDICTED: putative ATP-dependent RNA helicase DHX57 isoform X1 [Branchiostoma belcheri]|uniref:RNA helicase n=1 Tax=Branchiostoma belcheri TaxID=7741 RepID=A0A6P4YWR0_BRABE|nr:PREDICTED: putative ATP-dependent RNA helicase DHX57 isoform X1 [Branchiostoma belcheri]